MHFTSKLFITISKLERGEIVKSQRFESKSFTRWAKILMANLAAAAGYTVCGNDTITFTPMQIKNTNGDLKDIYTGEDDIHRGRHLFPFMSRIACGDSDAAFDETQHNLSNWVANADTYDLLTNISLDGTSIKFSLRSYFVVVSDFTMKESALFAKFENDTPEPDEVMISRDLLETPYECKTDEVYIVDYEFIYGSD